MKNMGETPKKPIVLWGLIGALGLTTAILAFKNNGFENQNNYLFNQNIDVVKRYSNLANKRKQTVEDSSKLSTQYFLELLSLKGDNLKLSYKLDSLQNDYANSVENVIKGYLRLNQDIDSLQEDYTYFADILKKAMLIKDENDFLKKYNHYLD